MVKLSEAEKSFVNEFGTMIDMIRVYRKKDPTNDGLRRTEAVMLALQDRVMDGRVEVKNKNDAPPRDDLFVVAARSALGITQAQLADLIGADLARIRRYEDGKQPLPKALRIAIQQLLRETAKKGMT